jgi:FMN phosphatase YigB (HAD superfamily)
VRPEWRATRKHGACAPDVATVALRTISHADVDQESKIARSGLAPLFHHIEIVSEKDEDTYRRLLNRYGVLPEEFAMVGNALHSDVLPVMGIGGRAFHVPEVTLGPDVAGAGAAHESAFQTLAYLGALLPVLDPPTK